ncbi:MAG: hypothetical protein V1854_02395, partial [Methanobacteriota archaeon]
FSRDVLLADLVLTSAYQSLLDITQRLKTGNTTVKLEIEHFKKLEEGLRLLADAFEKNESVLEPLELILTTAFSTSGAGNYLREKGLLEL